MRRRDVSNQSACLNSAGLMNLFSQRLFAGRMVTVLSSKAANNVCLPTRLHSLNISSPSNSTIPKHFTLTHCSRNKKRARKEIHKTQLPGCGQPTLYTENEFFFSPNRCCPPLLPEFLTQSFFPLFLSSKCFVSAATTEGRGDVTSALKHPILKRSHNVDSCNRYACRAW